MPSRKKININDPTAWAELDLMEDPIEPKLLKRTDGKQEQIRKLRLHHQLMSEEDTKKKYEHYQRLGQANARITKDQKLNLYNDSWKTTRSKKEITTLGKKYGVDYEYAYQVTNNNARRGNDPNKNLGGQSVTIVSEEEHRKNWNEWTLRTGIRNHSPAYMYRVWKVGIEWRSLYEQYVEGKANISLSDIFYARFDLPPEEGKKFIYNKYGNGKSTIKTQGYWRGIHTGKLARFLTDKNQHTELVLCVDNFTKLYEAGFNDWVGTTKTRKVDWCKLSNRGRPSARTGFYGYVLEKIPLQLYSQYEDNLTPWIDV